MESLPILVAAVFAVGVILIFAGFASASRVDPVQARLSQLGTMQARNLEELELQQPVFERTLRPMFDSLAARVERLGSSSFTERTEKRLDLAGHPGDLAVADWMAVKIVAAAVGGVGLFALMVVLLGGDPFLGILFGEIGRAHV